jgi:hypothetical protein
MLDIKSINRGLLIPRLTTGSRNLIQSPAIGLLIYNTTTNQFNYYNGSTWYQTESSLVSSTTGTVNPGGGVSVNTQQGILPDNSAILDINNSSRGILVPRTMPNLITSPATGLIIHNTASNQLTYYNGSQWIALCSSSTGVSAAGGSQTSVGVAINTNNASPHHSAILDVSSTGKGMLIPRLNSFQRNNLLPAAGLTIYNTSVNAIEFYNGSAWHQLKTNQPATPAAGNHLPSATQIVWNWNAVAGATGYKWSTANNYNAATNMGTTTTKTETGLTCNTSYSRYVWAYNVCGYSSPVTLTQTSNSCTSCGAPLTVNHVPAGVAPVTKTVTYASVSNIPGETTKCWITSNLGADHQATSVNDATEASAGWYWQFNRKQGYKHDGASRTPGTAWITAISENLNWEAANDPCLIELAGTWRLPTQSEWYNVDVGGSWTEWSGPWNSNLKLHAAGLLNDVLYSRGTAGFYWSSTQYSTVDNGIAMYFNSSVSYTVYSPKAYASTVRCIKNQENSFPYIGQSYGGGIIFYIDGTGQHGLIAAPNDCAAAEWGCENLVIPGAFNTDIGTGQANSNAILSVCDSVGYAAQLCEGLYVNGYTDWYLPSSQELQQMYSQRINIGNLVPAYYWSSTDCNCTVSGVNGAKFVSFQSGGTGGWALPGYKTSVYNVRAIRSF